MTDKALFGQVFETEIKAKFEKYVVIRHHFLPNMVRSINKQNQQMTYAI